MPTTKHRTKQDVTYTLCYENSSAIVTRSMQDLLCKVTLVFIGLWAFFKLTTVKSLLATCDLIVTSVVKYTNMDQF